jgi:hypothetical protein
MVHLTLIQLEVLIGSQANLKVFEKKWKQCQTLGKSGFSLRHLGP